MENDLTSSAVDDSQRKAARVAGFMYLFLMAARILGFLCAQVLSCPATPKNNREYYRVRTTLSYQHSYRPDWLRREAVIAVALYTLLKRVNRSLALLAALWRVTDGAILGVSSMITLVLLLFLNGAPYLRAFSIEQLHSQARVALSAYATGYSVGFLFLALGGALFSYLLFKSRYIPRALAAWGVFSYVVMLAGVFAAIIFPNMPKTLELATEGPAGIFEILAGFWLLFKGVTASNWSWFSTVSDVRPIAN